MAIALGVITCPSPDPIDANIERKLHDADAALLHSNDAAISGTERSSQYFLFRRVEVFIWVSFILENRVRRGKIKWVCTVVNSLGTRSKMGSLSLIYDIEQSAGYEFWAIYSVKSWHRL